MPGVSFAVDQDGGLALDRGLHAPPCGPDHPLDPACPTVAHTAVLAVGPEDFVPMPLARGEDRPIASDGGQRRVGSGWGIDPTPPGIGEWQSTHERVPTGRIVAVRASDGPGLAAGEITPARSSAPSGPGTLPDPTRHAERHGRVLAGARVDDVAFVLDRVVSTDPMVAMRWLLHMEEEPRGVPDGFAVTRPPAGRPGPASGRIDVQVLGPLDPRMIAVGGPGAQVEAGDRSRDDGARRLDPARPLRHGVGESGAWRVEARPTRQQDEDDFTVVMTVRRGEGVAPVSAPTIADGTGHAREIIGAARRPSWRVPLTSDKVPGAIEPGRGSETRSPRPAPAPPPHR